MFCFKITSLFYSIYMYMFKVSDNSVVKYILFVTFAANTFYWWMILPWHLRWISPCQLPSPIIWYITEHMICINVYRLYNVYGFFNTVQHSIIAVSFFYFFCYSYIHFCFFSSEGILLFENMAMCDVKKKIPRYIG